MQEMVTVSVFVLMVVKLFKVVKEWVLSSC